MEIECGKHECSSSCMRCERHTTLQVCLCDHCFSVVDIEEELLGWDEWEAIDGLCCHIDEILGDMVMAQVSPCEDMEDKYEDVRRNSVDEHLKCGL